MSQLTPAQQAITAFTGKINGNYVQNQLKQVLGENAGTFATSIVEVFTNDTQLQQCDPNKVVQEAIKAATLKLPLNKQLGYAYIITFKNWDRERRASVPTPTLVIGYKGFIQLAMRTGQYRNINADVVYEGELRIRDKITGQIDLSGDRISDKVVGFFAYFEMINGFSKMLYMTLEEMAQYALKFSPSFKRKSTPENPLPSVDNLCAAAQQQAISGPIQGKVGWEGDFLSMAQKTVLRRLISKYGYLSIEMMSAQQEDEERNEPMEIRDADVIEEKPTFQEQEVEEEVLPEDDEEAPI